MDTNITSLLDAKYRIIMKKESLCVKGNYRIASYDENMIILNCSGDSVCVCGDGIVIASLSSEDIYINGNIESVSFA